MDLVTEDDIEARLGRPLTAAEQLRIVALMADASAAVRREAKQQFTPGTSTITIPNRGHRIRLPQRPVTGITEVVDAAGTTLAAGSYRLVGDILHTDLCPLNAWEIEPYRIHPEELVVTYTHGDDVVPPDIVAVTCSVVMRAMGTNPTEGGITQQTIDGYTEIHGMIGAAGPIGLLPSELAICRDYDRPRGAHSINVS